MTPHRRRLPHVYPEGAALFLTWHLHGSVPASLLPPPRSLASGQAFVWLDRELDTLRRGPRYLHRPDIAQIVVNSIRKGVDLENYELGAYAVMPNHVHLLIRPSIAPERLMKSLKGASAREANRVLGRTGEPFWQKESYDPWVRNRRTILGRARASRRVSTRHARVRAPRSGAVRKVEFKLLQINYS